MSLNGSLDGFALPDVLVLLATTKKTGELRVWGDRSEGSVWLDTGQVVGAHTTESTDVVEAVADLLRLRSGGFSFEIRDPEGRAAARAMEAVLGEAQGLLDEWHKIEAVVPSPDAFVRLADEPPTPEVKVKAGQWKVLVHLAGAPGSTVNQMRAQLHLSELAVARAVKELVDAGLARVGDDEPPAATVPASSAGDDLERVWATARRAPVPEGAGEAPTNGKASVVEIPTEVEGAAPANGAETRPAEPINRDVLLKFISSSRG